MDNTGIVALSEALGNNASIEALHLWDNELNDDQAVILLEGLVRNTLLLEFVSPETESPTPVPTHCCEQPPVT